MASAHFPDPTFLPLSLSWECGSELVALLWVMVRPLTEVMLENIVHSVTIGYPSAVWGDTLWAHQEKSVGHSGCAPVIPPLRGKMENFQLGWQPGSHSETLSQVNK
jgi:hypothetical protein